MIIDANIALKGNSTTAYERYLESKGQLLGFKDAEALIASMDQRGIEKGVILHGSNLDRLAALEKYPDRLYGFHGLTFADWKKDSEKAAAQIAASADAGFLGIGSLNPYAEAIQLDDAVMLEIGACAREFNLAIHFTCSCPVGETTPGRTLIPPYEIEAFAYQFPDIPIILSCYGGLLFTYELMPEVPPRFNHVFYETSAPVDAIDHAKIIDVAGKIARNDRLIYGSGLPRSTDDPKAAIEAAPIAQEMKDGILGGNLFRIIEERKAVVA